MALCLNDCDEIEHIRFKTPENECINNLMKIIFS